MRAPLLLTAAVLLSALCAPSVGAQGPGASASARITVVVPESRTPAPAPRRDSAGAAGPASSRERGGSVGRNGPEFCSATLSFGVIGRASVSCLDTAEPGHGATGVAIEIAASSLAAATPDGIAVLEVVLPGAALIRIPLRRYSRGGVDILRATLPAAAFERMAAASALDIRIAEVGVARVAGGGELAGLRRVATDLRSAGEDAEQARR